MRWAALVALPLLAVLMTTAVEADCDLWPGDPSQSSCSASSMFRLNAQRTGRSPFAGPGAAVPQLYQMASQGSPLVGPSYMGESDTSLEGSPFFLEHACADGTCPGYLAREPPVNSTLPGAEVELGTSEGAGRQGWPTLSDTGVAYVTWISAEEATLSAYDILGGGGLLWQHPYGVQSPIVAADGNLVVYSEDNLASLDPLSGLIVWNVTVASGATITGVALGYNGLLYAGYYGDEGVAIAVYSSDGEPQFNCLLGGTESGGMPMVRSDGSVVYTSESTIYVISGTECSIEWYFSPEPSAFSTTHFAQMPALGSLDQIYINTEEHLIAVNAAGIQMWNMDLLENHGGCYPPITDANDVVYILAGGCSEDSSDAVLMAYEGNNGTKLWTIDLPEAGEADVYQTHPVISGDGDIVFTLRRYFVASLEEYDLDVYYSSSSSTYSSAYAPVDPDGPSDLLFLVFLAAVLIICCVLISVSAVVVRIQAKGKEVYESIQ